MKYRISHRTTYEYSTDVSLSEQILRLEPRTTRLQTVQDVNIKIEPEPAYAELYRDGFGNHSRILTIEQPHRRFVVEGLSEVDVRTPPDVDAAATRLPMTPSRPMRGRVLRQAGQSSKPPSISTIESTAISSMTPPRPRSRPG